MRRVRGKEKEIVINYLTKYTKVGQHEKFGLLIEHLRGRSHDKGIEVKGNENYVQH